MNPIISINQDTDTITASGNEKMIQINRDNVTTNNGTLIIKKLSQDEVNKINDAISIINNCFNFLPNLPLQEVLFNNKDKSVFIKAKNLEQCTVDVLKQTQDHQVKIDNFVSLISIAVGEPIITVQWINQSLVINRIITRDLNSFDNQTKASISEMAFISMQILSKENNLNLSI